MIMPDLQKKEQLKKAASQALLRLAHNEDFEAYQRYIELYLLETREKGDLMIGHEKEWNQGWCQALVFILGLPESIKLELHRPLHLHSQCQINPMDQIKRGDNESWT